VKHSTTEATNATTPVIQVHVRRPRHAAIVSGLAVGQQLAGRQCPKSTATEPGGPQAGAAVIGQPGSFGNGGVLREAPLGEREQQRGPEDGDHDRD